jgi:hypothetical protein
VSSPRPGRLLAATRLGEGAAALAARHGVASDKPAIRSDAVIRRVVQLGEVNWVVKNPETTKYYNFDDGEWGLCQLFDGTRTLAQIQADYQAMFPREKVEMSLVREYEEMLREMGLIEQSAAERNLKLLANARTARQRAAEEKAEGFNPFFLLFNVLDPNRFLDRTVKYVRWIWTPPVVAGALVFAAWAFGVILVHWDTVWGGTMELYALTSKPLIDVLQFLLSLAASTSSRTPTSSRSTAATCTTSGSPSSISRPPSTATRRTRSSFRTSGTGSGSRRPASTSKRSCARSRHSSGSCRIRTRSSTRSPSRRCSSRACRRSSSTSIP